MSPEQCRGTGDVDHRSDIYSFACVMMKMLTGKPPFAGQGSGDLIASHLREPAPLASSRVPDMPEIVDQILQKCLAKSPDERFQSMPELAQALAYAEGMLQRASVPTMAMSYAPDRPSMQITNQLPLTPQPPTPTTLSGASGQTPLPTRPHNRRGVIIGAAVSTLAIGSLVAVIAVRKSADSHARPPVAPEMHVAAPPPAPPVPPPPPVTVPMTPDAGVADASAPDAAVAKPPTHKRNSHASTPGAPPPDIDRGD
jgi:serine/threonine-protein kinase